MEVRIGASEFDALANRVFLGWCEFDASGPIDVCIGWSEFDTAAHVASGGYDSKTRSKAARKIAPATTKQQTHKYAELLTASGKLTKAAKKKRREEVEQQVLELLPDSPAAIEAAATIAQAVVRREAAFLAEHAPLVMEPDSAPLPQFDPQPVIKEMVKRWKPPVVRHPDDEFEVESLLLLG